MEFEWSEATRRSAASCARSSTRAARQLGRALRARPGQRRAGGVLARVLPRSRSAAGSPRAGRKAYGGADATPWRHAILSEEMWRVGEPRGSQYMNVNWIGPTIMKYGSEEQKAFHLPKISAGNVLWCQGFSEPEAGSDLVSLRTAAVRDGRRLRRERLEDLDLVRGRRRVLLPARAHRPELEAPPRHQRAARADGRARDRRCARCPR